MKKVFIVIALIAAMVMLLVGCGNKDWFDTQYTYDKAIIELANGEVVEVNIKSWTDYENGEQLQIIAEDGTVYLTNSFRCDLIDTKD